MNKGNGKVYLTGGGCGEIELLTIKAAEVLRRCDTVVYDSLAPEALLRWTKPDCEKIYVGKRYGSHAMKQSKINDLLVEKALEGKTVVRLKGGDPYVFGRGGEEFLALQAAGVSCEEIPGISSAIAVPAAAGIPVTYRGLSAAFTVVTGTAAGEDGQGQEEDPGQENKPVRKTGLCLDFDTLARLSGTLVILMGMHHLREITAGLLSAGKSPDTPCAVVMEGTTGRQRCLRTVLGRLYEEAKEQGFTSPAVIVVGAVTELQLTDGLPAAAEGKRIEGRLLAGVTVGVTGTPHFAGKLAAALEQEWAAVKDMSFMEVRQTGEPLPEPASFRWLVFTSPNGVSVFFDKMKRERRDVRSLYGKKIAVIGPGTAAALEENRLYADYMPDFYDAEHLAWGLTERILQEDAAGEGECPAAKTEEAQEQVLFLRARQGSESLPLIFQEKGISYVDYPLYELGVCEEKRIGAVIERPDYVVFGSALGVRAYFEGLERDQTAENDAAGCSAGEVLSSRESCAGSSVRQKYVCIGEKCGEELRKHTTALCLTAEEASVEGIVACIRQDRAHEIGMGRMRLDRAYEEQLLWQDRNSQKRKQ